MQVIIEGENESFLQFELLAYPHGLYTQKMLTEQQISTDQLLAPRRISCSSFPIAQMLV
jgi:hypothetical protein